MKTPVTIDSLLSRVRREVQQKEVQSAAKKAEARTERARRSEPAISMYAQESLWVAVALHREYQVQICDSCKGETTIFLRDKVELQHKVDRSARRWLNERGEGMSNLPIRIEIQERVIPECFCCLTVGRTLNHLFKGTSNEAKESVVPAEAIRQGQASEVPAGGPTPPPEARNQDRGASPAVGG